MPALSDPRPSNRAERPRREIEVRKLSGRPPVRSSKRSGRPPARTTPSRYGGSPVPAQNTHGERLQRTLARAGLGSRRAVEDLIRQGRVRVGGEVASLGRRVDPWTDHITVDDIPIPVHPDLRYLALNKPAGVTTTARDPHAERTVAMLIPPGPRVFPVGRLDRPSEGLLLLTNDGDLAHRLQHPRFGVDREYLVEVKGIVPKRAVSQLLKGVDLADGPARALKARPTGRSRGRTSLAMVMREGRKREIRRMLGALGFPVLRLVRVRIGPVRLGSLPPGRTRTLTAQEVSELYRESRLSRARPGGRGTDSDSPSHS